MQLPLRKQHARNVVNVPHASLTPLPAFQHTLVAKLQAGPPDDDAGDHHAWMHTTIFDVRCSCDLEKLNTENRFPGSGISLNLRVLTWNNLFFERCSKRQCRKLEIFKKLIFMIPKKTDSCEGMKIKICPTTVLLLELERLYESCK